MGLTRAQVQTLIVIERTTASISAIGTLLLLSTFIFIKSFRTLSNTLIFYASFANLLANVGALIGGSATAQVNSPLCQFQGFLMQMFLQSDPLWSLAMAVNVYLVFFRRYDAHRLKKLHGLYFLLCYGIPFTTAMVCLLYRREGRGRIYGNATLWCWISTEWVALRIYTCYIFIWTAILATFIIYIRVGIEVFRTRSQLRALSGGGGGGNGYATGTLTTISADPQSDPTTQRPQDAAAAAAAANEPFTGIRTTEVQVTHNPWKSGPLPSAAPLDSDVERAPRRRENDDDDNHPVTSTSHAVPGTRRRPSSMDKVKWAYTRCALLFAMSILITWVPATVNRIHGVLNPTTPSYGLSVASAIVLPLQGFWNTVIYFTTSLGICRRVWAGWKLERRGARGRDGVEKWRWPALPLSGLRRPAGRRRRKDKDPETETESTVDLSSGGSAKDGNIGFPLK